MSMIKKLKEFYKKPLEKALRYLVNNPTAKGIEISETKIIRKKAGDKDTDVVNPRRQRKE